MDFVLFILVDKNVLFKGKRRIPSSSQKKEKKRRIPSGLIKKS
jgi:hypothetical protein